MKGLHLVCVMCVWLLPQRLHGTGTPAQTLNGTDSTTAGVMVSETRQPFSNTAQQRRTAASQAHGYLSAKITVMAKSLSTAGPLSLRTKRALALGQTTDGQTKQPNKSSANTSEKMESQALGGKVSSGPIQATTISATPGALKNSPRSLIVLNQSTKIQPSQTPSTHASSQTNSSTVGIQSMNTVSTSTPPALVTQAKYSSSFSPTKGTDNTVSPTDKDLTGPSESPANATSNTTPPSTEGPKPTSQISTRGTSARPAENDSTSRKSISKTSKAPTKKPINPTIRAKKTLSTPSPKPRGKKPQGEHSNGNSHGTVVAVLILGALMIMMFGFLLIYLKKRKLRKQQTETADWAGPSPFLDGGSDNNVQVERRSSNRISLSGFLPQRLSKRLSLLKEMEMEQELQEITPGTTFRGGENEEEAHASNGSAVIVVAETQRQETHTTERPPSPVVSTPPPAAAPLVDVDLGEEHSATPSPAGSSPTNEASSTPPPAETTVVDVDRGEEHSATPSPEALSPNNESSSTPAEAPLEVADFGEERSKTPPAPPDATGDNTPLPQDDGPMPNFDQPNPSLPASDSAVNVTLPDQPSLVST